MAIAATMNGDENKDGHEHDVVMPGFRFHPTEEELIEFYLRRKVEGKRFNVELITFLDLYRYDPWELPALAAIGEKEWFFYVPRDRKYRNGDRPNRVTTSGYWKATGADRMIRTESSRSIGLKKTLVFYSGKAPKGIRTSWIMNEYRLPQSETDRYQKGEISLCRVYKRAGVEDHFQLPSKLSSQPSSSKAIESNKKHDMGHRPSSNIRTLPSSSEMEKMHEVGGCSSTDISMSAPLSHKHTLYSATAALNSTTLGKDDERLQNHTKNMDILGPTCTLLSSNSSSMANAAVDELSRLVGNQQSYMHHPNQFLPLPSHSQLLPVNSLPTSLPTISDKLWEWNTLLEAGRDHTSFK